MRANEKTVDVHAGDKTVQRIEHFVPQLDQRFGPLMMTIQQIGQREAQSKNLCFHRFGNRRFVAFRIAVEECQIVAEVEDVEKLFILCRSKQVGTQPDSPSDHLPEFGLGTDSFEEDQIHAFRYVDPRVEHIHTDCNLREFIDQRKVINQRLGRLHLIIDQLAEMPLQVRMIRVKPFTVAHILPISVPKALRHHQIDFEWSGLGFMKKGIEDFRSQAGAWQRDKFEIHRKVGLVSRIILPRRILPPETTIRYEAAHCALSRSWFFSEFPLPGHPG